MKTILNTLFITAAAVFAFSCEKPANDNITPSEENLVELTLTVGADTKTQLGGENNRSIIWQENDKLIVFDGTANREFAIKDFEPGKNSAVFTGLAFPAEKYYVVHSTAEGSEPVFTVPEEGDPYVTGILVANVQKAVKGSYDPAAFASVGIAEVKEGETDLSVQMRNTCSLVKVSLKSSDIKTVEISTTDEKKYLTAKCRYTFKEYPGIAAQSDQYLSAVLDSESAMEPGDYYIAILPRDLTNLTVTYTKADGSTASVTAEGKFDFTRSSIVSLGIDDSKLDFSGSTPVTPSELVLTVDCSNQPFTEKLETTSDNAKTQTTEGTWYLAQDEKLYPFVIYSAKGYGYLNNSIRLNEAGATPGRIRTPAIENMKLVSVYVNVTNSASETGKEVYVSTEKTDSAYSNYLGKQAFAKSPDAVSEKTFELTGTEANTSYYVVARHNKTQIAKLVLTYTSVTD